jgi:uncharacterized protein (DUF58 family)
MSSDEAREHLAEGERAGQRGISVGHRAGSSLEFRDYRDYQPGDDLRHVDWNAYARSDSLTIKLFREEVTPHADVLLDVTRSMALQDCPKARATRALGAFFAAAARNAGYSASAWQIASEIEPVENGTASPTLWQGLNLDRRGNPFEAFARGGPRWSPHGLRFFVSDLLWDGDPLVVLRHLSEQSSATVVVQLLAEADDEPKLGGNLRLVDAETEQVRELFIDEAALRRYRDNLRRHQENWNRACKQTGAIFMVVVAERLLAEWRLDELVAAEVLAVV